MFVISILASVAFLWGSSGLDYFLIDDYVSEGFLDKFDFIAHNDSARGYVNYMGRDDALKHKLFQQMHNGSIYIGVDSNNISSGRGRNSVRIHSKAIYNHGLFILDLERMPGSICGTWPAYWFWDREREWPINGEINIVEISSVPNSNLISLHTEKNCHTTNSTKNYTGSLLTTSCLFNDPNQASNQGCQVLADRKDSYGDGFNQVGGGVYAMEWTSKFIKVWHFPRSSIPDDIRKNTPDPKTWKTPVANYYGNCDFDKLFRNQGIVFNIDFCGDWGNPLWDMHCKHLGPNCTDYVQNNPQAFRDAYWLINSLKVYSTRPITTPLWLKIRSSLYIGIPLFLIVLIVGLIFRWYCQRKQRNRQNSVDELINKSKRNGNKGQIDEPWTLKSKNLIVSNKKLGNGAFSTVFYGELIGNSAIKSIYPDIIVLSRFKDCFVAVKTLPLICSEDLREDFEQEINIMKCLGHHENLITFLGCVPDTSNPLLVLEFCQNGDLLSFLKDAKNQIELKPKNLISFAYQICNGLDFFTSLGFIHRDIAARNVLLTESFVCKICDFGHARMAEDKAEIYKSRGKNIPIKWAAIEALKLQEFSLKSDVWSYSVLLFELFSFGKVPYEGFKNIEVLTHLESGQRLPQPIYCPNEIFDLMTSCWQLDPQKRPSFAEIRQCLTKTLESATSYCDYLDMDQRLPV